MRMRRRLRQVQAECLHWANDRSRFACFVEMRLGKTLVAIRWAINRTAPTQHKLVVTPLSVIPAWQSELEQESHSAISISGKHAAFAALQNWDKVDWFITNYESLFRYKQPTDLCQLEWDLVILDESIRIANPNTITSKVCRRSFSTVPHRLVLTGLPAPEGYHQYWAQMAFVYGHFMGYRNFWKWRDHFFQLVNHKWVPRVGTVPAIRRKLKKLAFRRTRKQAGLTERKVREIRTVHLPARTMRAYRQMERDWCTDTYETKHKLAVQTYLRRIVSGASPAEPWHHTAKLKELVHLLQTELARDQVLVWVQFTSELKIIRARLHECGVSVTTIHGDTPPAVRGARMNDFRHGRVRVLVMQVQCGQYGLDASNASAAIFYSQIWSLNLRMQAEDRLVSVERKDPALLIDLVAANTIDETIVSRMRQKKLTAFADDFTEWVRKQRRKFYV